MSEAYLTHDELPEQYVTTQTPSAALKNPDFILRFVINVIVTFLVNVGIAALFQIKKQAVTVYRYVPDFVYDKVTYVVGNSMPVDLIVSAFICVAVSAALSTSGLVDKLKVGKAVPISPTELSTWRFLGVGIRRTWIRVLVYATIITLVLFPIFYLSLHGACQGDHMKHLIIDGNKECFMYSFKEYIWFKGFFLAITIVFASPLIEFGALNLSNIAQTDHDLYLNAIGVLPSE